MTNSPTPAFDFSMPLGAYGHSSAWSKHRGVSLFRYPELSPRRLVRLKPVSAADFIVPSGAVPSDDKAPDGWQPFTLAQFANRIDGDADIAAARQDREVGSD